MSIGQPGSLVVVVGSGGVGKTTIAAALGVMSALEGVDTLVMTFDPSMRLKDTLGVGERARDTAVDVELEAPGRLSASLLDARRTFDRLVERYAPDDASRRRIVDNRYYNNLAGHLAGVLEYMAVERLFEVREEGRFERIILDTPPTRQAIDFLEAPRRIVSFLDSGALKIALRPWFDADGNLRVTSKVPFFGRRIEGFLDRIVGLDLLRDMAEFFQAFEPLYEGFRDRAASVEAMLGSPETVFSLVSGPGPERIPDTMFFARKLVESELSLGQVVVNRVHPPVDARPAVPSPETLAASGGIDGRDLLHWLARRDEQGLGELRGLVGGTRLIEVPLLDREPIDAAGLARVADFLDAPWRAGRLAPRGADSPDRTGPPGT